MKNIAATFEQERFNFNIKKLKSAPSVDETT